MYAPHKYFRLSLVVLRPFRKQSGLISKFVADSGLGILVVGFRRVQNPTAQSDWLPRIRLQSAGNVV
jgi:hypothetical protein